MTCSVDRTYLTLKHDYQTIRYEKSFSDFEPQNRAKIVEYQENKNPGRLDGILNANFNMYETIYCRPLLMCVANVRTCLLFADMIVDDIKKS